ncbi:hypothetical protein CN97_11400 [Haematobacter massiliensis]|uniref:Uncharacterized protein n=1 Tax=Haematobacter massiliensis TaxID=195105 RepID=A0A086XSW8_9RHOB|nr:hypothetical protein CN97_11400 [Haematobacter massiliensis]
MLQLLNFRVEAFNLDQRDPFYIRAMAAPILPKLQKFCYFRDRKPKISRFSDELQNMNILFRIVAVT